MGKTAVFIIGILNQLSLIDGNYIPINCMVICHTRELAHQVFKDFRRFSRYFKSPDLRINCFFGGFPANSQRNLLQNKDQLPHIVIGTPGRLSLLIKEGYLPTDKVHMLYIYRYNILLLMNVIKF
jgi:superfamily II DNA/RNA helicase